MSEPNAQDDSKRTFASEAHVAEVLGEKPLNGYFTSLMHLCKCYVGSGIFAMGEAYKNSGLLMGSVLLILIGVINLNCQHILIRVCKKIADKEEEKDQRLVKPTFAETVQYTMEDSRLACLKNNSHKFSVLTNVFLCMCELGFCCVYFIFIAQHMLKVTAYFDLLDNNKLNKHLMLALILLPMWMSTFLGNLKLLLPLSITANFLVWTGICIIFYYTTYTGLNFENRHYVAPPERLPLFFGTTLFAFEGITFIIPLRNEMRNSNQFTSWGGVLNVGMVFVMSLYFGVGFLSYLKYGEEVEPSVFLNLDREDAKVAVAVYILMCICILCTFTLHMYIPFEILFPLFYRKYEPFKHPTLVMIAFRSVPVLLTWLLANIIPFLGLFIGLVGATAGASLALIMPAALELIAFQGENSLLTIIKNWFTMVLGVAGMLSGTAMTMKELVIKFQEPYNSTAA